MKKKIYFFILIFAAMSPVTLKAAVHKSSATAEVKLSTCPVGSPFVRYLAFDFHVDVKSLAKFEKRGFSRSEIITLLLISEKTKKPMKDYGKERLKDKTSLRDIAIREGLNYDELYQKVKDIKKDVESRGERDLPPPVFEPVATPTLWQ